MHLAHRQLVHATCWGTRATTELLPQYSTWGQQLQATFWARCGGTPFLCNGSVLPAGRFMIGQSAAAPASLLCKACCRHANVLQADAMAGHPSLYRANIAMPASACCKWWIAISIAMPAQCIPAAIAIVTKSPAEVA